MCGGRRMKDPLDKIFVDYHKQLLKGKHGAWEFKKIDFEFLCWINRWGDEDEHPECHDNDKKLTDFGKGYKQCISDIWDILKPDYKRYDKRTKDGFSKDG